MQSGVPRLQTRGERLLTCKVPVFVGELPSTALLDVKLPFKLEGKLTFQVKAAVPLRDVKDLKAYRFNGTANLPWARLEDLLLQDLRARVVYEQGVLRLEELSVRMPESARTLICAR